MAQDFRAQLRDAYSFQWLKERLDDLTGATRKRHHEITCKHCERPGRYEIDEADTRTQLDALKYIGDMGYGRAAQAKEQDTKPIPLGVDPTNMTSEARQQLITQLRTKLNTTQTENISPVPG